MAKPKVPSVRGVLDAIEHVAWEAPILLDALEDAAAALQRVNLADSDQTDLTVRRRIVTGLDDTLAALSPIRRVAGALRDRLAEGIVLDDPGAPEPIDLVCSRCGGSFSASRSDGRYCSAACRQAAYRARRSVTQHAERTT